MRSILNKGKFLIFNVFGILRDYTTVVVGLVPIVITLLCVLIVYNFYIQRVDVHFPVNRDELGQMGDYFGGLLNPVIAATALVLLYMNLVITQREFKETRNLVAQQLTTQIKQRFEDTFFSLLGQHNALLNVVHKSQYKFDWAEVDSPERAREKLWHDMDKNNYEIKMYFRFLYQLLKFIDSSEIEDKKTYSNLVRSFIDSDTGELILINALCFNDSNDFKEFKVFIEKYAFLEHVQIDTQLGKINNAIRVLNGDAMPTAWASNIPGVRSRIEQDNRREFIESTLIKKRFDFYSEITRDDRGDKYYKKTAYDDCHYYNRVRWVVEQVNISRETTDHQ